jgi:hypothetical protein
MSLEQELATYHAKLPEWKEHEGKFVLIKGERLVDIFSAYEDALKAGYKEFGLEPFMVRQIAPVPVFYAYRCTVMQNNLPETGFDLLKRS